MLLVRYEYNEQGSEGGMQPEEHHLLWNRMAGGT